MENKGLKNFKSWIKLWIHIEEGKEGLSGVGNYGYILESGRRDC